MIVPTTAELQLAEELIAFLVRALPALAADIMSAFAAWKQGHRPELGAPPPADGEATVDAAVDAEIAQLAPKTEPSMIVPDDGLKGPQ